MKLRLITIIIVLLTAIPIYAGPSAKDLAKADYGTPLPNNYQDIITSFMEGVLKDPYSAHYTFTPVGPVWQKDGLLFGGKLHCGYGVRVFVNAKNSYGGYTGDQEYAFILHDGIIIKMLTPDELQVQHNSLFKNPRAVF